MERNMIGEHMPDVVIKVGQYKFYLHQSCLVNCAFLRMLIRVYSREENGLRAFTLDGVPGGAMAFSIVMKFYYGQKFVLTSTNVVPVICAAHYLHMADGYTNDGLVAQAEEFLSTRVLTKWKESIAALLSCEDVLREAEGLGIVDQCLESLAGKVTYHKSRCSDWWYDDICDLTLPLFKRFVEILGTEGHDTADISSAVMYYANQYDLGADPSSTGAWSVDERRFLEEVARLLPVQKGATSTKYLLSMLCACLKLNANAKCIERLEQRIGAQLDESTLEDMLVPNSGERVEVACDIACITRIIENFVEENLREMEFWYFSSQGNASVVFDSVQEKMEAVAAIVDRYLTNVASNENLKMEQFLALACVIPDGARPCHDGIYRAICTYIKHGPWLSEQQQERLCNLLDVERLSRDACGEAMRKRQLPDMFMVKVYVAEIRRFLEQGLEAETASSAVSEVDSVEEKDWIF